MFIFQKLIDRSTLRQGFQIPVEYHALLAASPGGLPLHGETRDIKIFIDGVEFDAQLKNQGFNVEDFAGHADVVQIRYSTALAKHLRSIFSATWDYVEEQKALPENVNRKVTIRIPQDRQEFMALSTTTQPDVFMLDCLTTAEKQQVEEEVSKMDELDCETSYVPQIDPKATITEVTRVQRVRRLDRSIGDNLKRLYGYRCQMTGLVIGEEQGVHVVEAHHIEPFNKSMNNDGSNQIIISPSYHRIIHQANPVFDRSNLAFCFPNGLVERVKLNLHLHK